MAESRWSRWFESLTVPQLWRRSQSAVNLDVLRANSVEPAIDDLPLRENRSFPADMPRPGGEYGATGTPIFGGFISGEDYNQTLDGAKALLVYDQMRRSDAQVRATLAILKLPIRRATWDIDRPDGSTDPQDQAIADFCASALFDDDAMAQPWGFILQQILLKIDFGVSLVEKVFTVGELGEIRYHRLAPRLPRTIFRWIVDPETGTLEAIVQFAPKGGAFQYLTIPAKYAGVFCFEREGDNYFGRSVLRSAYQHWYRKQQMYNIDSVRLDRHGVGIPLAAIGKDHRPTDRELGEIKTVLKGMRVHERAYIVQPYGVEFKILTPGDAGRGGATGAIDSINHHNAMIANNILAGFLSANEQRRGSLTHTQTLAEIFQDSLQAIAEDIGGELVQQLIRPVCDLNFDMTGRKYPVVRVSGIDSVNVSELARALSFLGPSQNNPTGFVRPTPKTESWLRDLVGAPSEDDLIDSGPAAQGGVESPSPEPSPAASGTPGAAISSRSARATPAESPSSASRLSGGGSAALPPKTPAMNAATPDARGDSGGSVIAAPLTRPAGQPPMTEPTSIPPTVQPAAGQPIADATSIQLDPTVDPINAPKSAYKTLYGGPGSGDRRSKRLTPPWPEGPLARVGVPPPPGGVMGAPPIGFDTRIGNNDGYPLGLRRDPVVINGRAFGREPTARELAILNLHEIPDRLDTERDQLIAAIRDIRRQQLHVVVDQLVTRDANPSTGAFTDIRPEYITLPLTDLMYKAIRTAQDRMARFGAQQVRQELQRQGAPVSADGGRLHLSSDPPQLRRVFVVRHGETAEDYPATDRISSNSAVPLDDNGRATAHRLAVMFSQIAPLRIVTSDLERTQQTAAIIAQDRLDAYVVADGEWRPWVLGPDLTGMLASEAKPVLAQLLANPDTAPRDGESWHSCENRTKTAFRKTLTQARPDMFTVLVVHSWQMKWMCGTIAGLNVGLGELPTTPISPGAVLCLTVDEGGTIVRAWLADATGEPLEPWNLAADRPKLAAGASKATQKSALVSSAKIVLRRLTDAFGSSIADETLRARRRGLQGPDLKQAVLDGFDDRALERGVAREANQEINEAFALGRSTEASALADLVDTVQYSAIMDANTCEPCSDRDGEEYDYGSDEMIDAEPPNKDCLGGDQCRCVLLYLTSGPNELTPFWGEP